MLLWLVFAVLTAGQLTLLGFVALTGDPLIAHTPWSNATSQDAPWLRYRMNVVWGHAC